MTLLRKLVLFLCGMLLLNGSLVQAQTVWTARYNGTSNSADTPTRVVTDNLGFVYVAGTSYSANTSNDFVVIKYEPDGTPSESWPDVGHGVGVRRYSAVDDRLQGMAVDAQGNVVVVGIGITTTAPSRTHIVKYDSNGNQAWAVQYIYASTSFADVKVDAAGNIYLLVYRLIYTAPGTGSYLVKYTPQGTFSSTWPYEGSGTGVRYFPDVQPRVFDVSGSGEVAISGVRPAPGVLTAPSLQIVSWKYGAPGQLLWSSILDSSPTPYDYPTQVASDTDGNTYVAGVSSYPVNQSGDYLLMKFGPDGQMSSTWPDNGAGIGMRRYDRAGGTNDLARTMQLDGNGNMIVSGFSQRTNGVDVLTLKYDASGSLSSEWPDQGLGAGVRAYSISSINTNMSMQVDGGNNVLLAVRHPSNLGEYRVLEYSASGVLKTLGTFNGPNAANEEPRSIALDYQGNAFVTGISSGYGTSTDIVTQGYYRNGAPVANAGPDQTVPTDSNCQAVVTLSGSDSSDPDGDTLTYVWNGSFGSITGLTAVVTMERGTHEVTLTVTDKFKVSVSDTVTITVADQTPPVVTVPASYTVNAGADGLGLVPNVMADVVASDNCTAAGSLNKLQSPFSGTPVAAGTHEITVTVSDASGNITTKTVSLTVLDVTAPVIAGLTDVTAAANAQGQASVPNFAANATIADNVTAAGAIVVVQAPATGTLLGVGAQVVTVTATDAAGNSTAATATFTVVDTMTPTIVSLTSLTVSAGANGLGVVPNASGAVAVADNVTPVSALIISQSPTVGSAVGLGNHVITVTVTDAAGNSASTTVSLSVADTSAPVISSLTASPSLLSPASGKLLPVVITAVVTDNTDATPTTQIVSVTSNEAIVAPGPRVKNPDYQITGAMTLNLRAKSSTSAGRIYYVTVSSTDDAGNVAQSTVEVKVATTSGGGGGGKKK